MQKIAVYNGTRMSLLLLEERLASVNGLHVWQCSCGSKFMTVYYASYHCEKQHKGENFLDKMFMKKDLPTDTKHWNAFYTSVSDVIVRTIRADATVPSDPKPDQVDTSSNTEHGQLTSMGTNTDVTKVDSSSTKTPILINPQNPNYLKVEEMEVEELKNLKREIIDLLEEDVVEIKRNKLTHRASVCLAGGEGQPTSSRVAETVKETELIEMNKTENLEERITGVSQISQTDQQNTKSEMEPVYFPKSKSSSGIKPNSSIPAHVNQSLKLRRNLKKKNRSKTGQTRIRKKGSSFKILEPSSHLLNEQKQLSGIRKKNGFCYNSDGQQASSSQEANLDKAEFVPWMDDLSRSSTRHIAPAEPNMIMVPELQFPIPDPASYPYPNFCFVHYRIRLVNPDNTPTRFLWLERANFYHKVKGIKKRVVFKIVRPHELIVQLHNYRFQQLNLDPFVARDLWMKKNVPNDRAQYL